VFLIKPYKRQLTDTFEYESDIPDVVINLSGRSRFVSWWDCGFEFRL